MALNSGFDELLPSSTFAQWFQKTNEMIVLMRNDVMTANSSTANTTGNARLLGTFIANTVYTPTIGGGNDAISANLVITTNTTISNSNLLVEKDLTLNGNLNFVLKTNNFQSLIPATANSFVLGNTGYRWNKLSVHDIDSSGNAVFSNNVVANNASISNLVVTESVEFGDLPFSGTIQVENIRVTGVAEIDSIEVAGLVANGAAITSNEDIVNSSTSKKIDTFNKTITKGFKYIIHGVNANSNSAYVVEMMCAHNDTEIFFTRFAEVSNQFNVTLTPQLNGANVELIAVCPNASVSNVHTFNLMRIETR